VYKDMPNNSVAVCSPTRVLVKQDLDNRFYKRINDQWHYYDNECWIKDNTII
jgi:hypothetical protein